MTEETERKSIIDPKYAAAMRDRGPDWLGRFIEDHASEAKYKTVKVLDAEGKPTGETTTEPTGKYVLNKDSFLALCRANGLDVSKWEDSDAMGRMRMTLGNSLRAIAKKRHGLNTGLGEFVECDDADFIGDTPKTQNPDGSKIAVAVATDTEEAA